MPREYLAESAPGALDSLPRMFLAFELPAGFERVTFTLEVRGKPNGCVVLKAKAEGPWREKTPSQLNGRNHYEIVNGLGATHSGPYSEAFMTLCGDLDAGRLFKAFFAGETTLSIVADWIEDDITDRVKSVEQHWIEAHRLNADPVYHFLTLMRCYRDRRKAKKTKRLEGDNQ